MTCGNWSRFGRSRWRLLSRAEAAAEEEVNPSLSASENVRHLCFVSNALLRDDFNQTFNVVFGEEAVTKRRVLMCLSDASRTLSEICEALGVERNGGITVHLEDLEVAGFVTCERSVNPQTGRSAKICRYRICDNYTRFFLRYIEPNGAMIDVDSFLFNSLRSLEIGRAVSTGGDFPAKRLPD